MYPRYAKFAAALFQLALAFTEYFAHEPVQTFRTNAELPFLAKYVTNPLQCRQRDRIRNIVHGHVALLASGKLKAILKKLLPQPSDLLAFPIIHNMHLAHTL